MVMLVVVVVVVMTIMPLITQPTLTCQMALVPPSPRLNPGTIEREVSFEWQDKEIQF